MNAETANGLPVILVSDRLRDEASVALYARCGIATLHFSVAAATNLIFVSHSPFPPIDTIIAIVADEAESLELSRVFGALERPGPPVLVTPSPPETATKIIEVMLSSHIAASRREASLREQLYSIRQEAEETRAALRRLRTEYAPLAPQSLVAIWLVEPAPAHEDIVYRGPFDFSIATRAEIYGLTAVSLHLVAERASAEDRLEVVLLGEEKGDVLGIWTLPWLEIPRTRDWLTLDLPVSLALARQTARIRVRGYLSEGSVIAFARGVNDAVEGNQQVALRLYKSSAPRLASAPFWSWADVDSAPAEEVVAIPAHSWLGAVAVGASSALGPAHAVKRLRLQGGGSALIVFPDVPLSRASAIAIRLRTRDGENITAAVALLPLNWDKSGDPTAAALCWSPLQTVSRVSAIVSLALPQDAPRKVQVAVALCGEDLSADETAVVVCEGAWLLQRALRRELEMFATAAQTRALRDTDFDDLRLDETYADDNYRHLDITMLGLSEGGRIWRIVKFKLFEDQGTPGLEFRSGADLPVCFLRWPGTEADRFGPYFKLLGAEAFASAIATLPEEDDRRLLAAIEDILPSLMRSLIGRGDIGAEDGGAWLAIAKSLRRTTGDVDAV